MYIHLITCFTWSFSFTILHMTSCYVILKSLLHMYFKMSESYKVLTCGFAYLVDAIKRYV